MTEMCAHESNFYHHAEGKKYVIYKACKKCGKFMPETEKEAKQARAGLIAFLDSGAWKT